MASYTQVNGIQGHNYSIFNFNYQPFDLYSNLNDIEINDGSNSVYLNDYDRLQFADLTLASGDDLVATQAYRLYKAAFDRTPDLAGLGYWIHKMGQGVSLLEVSNSFINSAEFNLTYGNVDTRGFVQLLYQNVLDREPDTGGYEYWNNVLNTGALDRAGVLAKFSESAENIANTSVYTDTGVLYIPEDRISPNGGAIIFFNDLYEYIDEGNYYWETDYASNSDVIFSDVGYGADIADYFEFTAETNGLLTILLEDLTDDIDLVLYDQYGVEINYSNNAGSESESITFEQQAGFIYIVGVEPYIDASSYYTLIIA